MRSQASRFRILALAVLLLGACDRFLSVSGEIRDEAQRPLSAARVRLLADALPDTGVLLPVDATGAFSFFQAVAPAVAPRELEAELQVDAPGRKSVTVRLPAAQRVFYELRVMLPPDSARRPAEVLNRLRTVPRRPPA